MQDRQLFERTALSNGILAFSHRVDAPICCLEIQLPAGAAHAVAKNGFIPGSTHFLEHLQFIRSSRFPEPHSLDVELGLRGCHFNATTYRSKTTYWIDCPAEELPFASEALFDRTYRPFFDSGDMATERSVVANERDSERFYPGRNRVSQYYGTQFMRDVPYPIEQLFGSDDDLAAMDPSGLSSMHARIAGTAGAVAIAVGGGDFNPFFQALSELEADGPLLERELADTSWADRSYREIPFDTVSRPTLEAAWIHPRASYREKTAVGFLLNLLTNPVHGTLHRELRQERGWTYGVNHYMSNHRQTLFGLSIPVNTIEQLREVRGFLGARLMAGAADQLAAELEIRRRLNQQVFNFQTAGAIMSGASQDLLGNKRVYTEREWRREIEAMADPAWRKQIAEKFFNPADMGCIGFVPAAA